jgi:hypothetical protein
VKLTPDVEKHCDALGMAEQQSQKRNPHLTYGCDREAGEQYCNCRYELARIIEKSKHAIVATAGIDYNAAVREFQLQKAAAERKEKHAVAMRSFMIVLSNKAVDRCKFDGLVDEIRSMPVPVQITVVRGEPPAHKEGISGFDLELPSGKFGFRTDKNWADRKDVPQVLRPTANQTDAEWFGAYLANKAVVPEPMRLALLLWRFPRILKLGAAIRAMESRLI